MRLYGPATLGRRLGLFPNEAGPVRMRFVARARYLPERCLDAVDSRGAGNGLEYGAFAYRRIAQVRIDSRKFRAHREIVALDPGHFGGSG